MKILMDLLAIQSEGSRNRGIGRYSQELSKEILKNLQEDASIALSMLYPEYEKEIINDYKSIVTTIDIKKYDIMDISNKFNEEKSRYSKLNTLLLKRQFIKDTNIDIIHFNSIFEGLGGKGDTLNDFSDMNNFKKAITIYDLIPLIYKDIYLIDAEVKKWYFNKLRLIYEADLLLAISDATKEDAINILGIPEDKIINISGAIDKKIYYKMDNEELKQNRAILDKYTITQPYIIYTGGIDFRKNIESSIKAFSKINTKNFKNHQYVIVCKITDQQKQEFKKIIKQFNIPKNKVIFTGFVTDQELNFLYNSAQLLLFPSLYEGFGLPVLEAITCGTVAIGSNISSIPEIIGRDDCMFDPTDVSEISKTIDYILDDEKLRMQLQEYFYHKSQEFSWENSAKITIEAYKKLHKKKLASIQRIKVAFFSPLPTKRSGISDYSLELLPFLSKYMDIDIYVDNYKVEDDYLNANFNIFSYEEFEGKKEEYEQIIYQFGNSEFHEYMYDIALRNPGIIVLHDFFLSDLINYMSHKRCDSNFFFENLKYSHGIDKQDNYDIQESIKTLPINKKIIDSAKAVIVHSTYAKSLFAHYYKDNYNIYKINQLIKTPSVKILDSKAKYKKILGFTDEDILISAFGHITDTKQYDFIIEAFKEGDIYKNENVKLVFIGDFISDIYKSKIDKMIKKYKLETRVKITGFVSDDEYRNYLLASDIGISLRVNSRGETSRALLMNMAYALPNIINDYASFSELPDDATCKVILNSQEDFITKIKSLIEQKDLRESIGKNAYKYILNEHNIEDISQVYYDCCYDMKKTIQSSNNIIKQVADTIVEHNLDELLSDTEYKTVATILKNSV